MKASTVLPPQVALNERKMRGNALEPPVNSDNDGKSQVNIQKLWKITIFSGKINYKSPFLMEHHHVSWVNHLFMGHVP